MSSPAARLNANIISLIACRAIGLSLEHGNGDASCLHYAWLGRFVARSFGDYQANYRFGRLACDLVDLRGLTRFQSQVYFGVASNTMPWGQPVKDGRALFARALDAARSAGNLIYEAYSLIGLGSNMLIAGDPLGETQRTIEASLPRIRQMKFRYATELVTMQLDYIRTLRGHSRAFASFDDLPPEDGARAFEGNPELAALETLYWIRALQARFVAGDYAAASKARSMAEPKMWAHPTEVVAADFHFFGALCLAALCPTAADQSEHLEPIRAHHSQLKAWEANCPANFKHRCALVGAEIARIEGRETEAMRLYERAVRTAEGNGYPHHKAMACELAGYFYEAQALEKLAQMHLKDAHHQYRQWGAQAKVGQLERRYPQLAEMEPAAGSTNTIRTSIEQLDLTTVIEMSQAVSGEIVIEKLIHKIMLTAMAQAGAERALLIMPGEQELRIEAEATTSRDTVAVHLIDEPITAHALPQSVLNYVLRTHETANLDDAEAQPPFSEDSYVRQRRARSILCLPLLNRAKLIGVLYLENNLTARVFVLARVSILKLLASQAAVAIENAHLYREVAEREKQSTATAEVLRTISSAPSDIQSALDVVAEHAASVCGASNARIWRLEDNRLRLVASYGESPATIHGRDGLPVDRDTVTGRAARDRRTIHVHDLAVEDGEYPVGSRHVREEGWRTTLATPLLREGEPVGTILVRRMEVRPFRDQQIALLETFADQAAIAIENMRLFDVERQRTAALVRANRDLVEREANIRRLVDGLRRSEAYLAEAEKLSHTGGWAVNRKDERRIVYWSAESYRIFGFDPLYGVPTRERVWETIHPADRGRLRGEADAALLEKRDYLAAFRLVMPDGSIKHLESAARHVFSADGGLLEIMGTFVDVTERKQAEASLRTVQAELAHVSRVSTLGQLAASIAHEVNQPVGSARNYAGAALNFLDRSPPELGEVRRALSRIVAAADRAGGIIERIRNQIKKMPPRSDVFDLNQAIEEVIGSAQSMITENRVSVGSRLARGMAPVRADRVQVQQVVLNLVLNAIEAMSAVAATERKLFISTEQTEAHDSLVVVRDSGPGIDPTHRDLVFQAFYSTKSGMGMGLSICRSIVAAHGGRMWATGVEPRGAQFQFTLPSAAAK
jgi:PAS domain S-box-containing protein